MANRNQTFDIIRGYFLLVILVDHLQLFPSIFQFATGRGELWVTAAEGFFFISGLMIGVLRGGQIAKRGFGFVAKKVSRRALHLYVVAVTMTLLLTTIGHSLLTQGLTNYKSGLSLANWPSIISKTLSFQYMYGWADFLYYYAAYLVAAIPILWLLHKKDRWLEVSMLSVGLFLMARALLGWSNAGWLVWQLYFFGGLVVGFKLPVLKQWYSGFAESTRRRVENDIVAIAGVALGISAVFTFALPDNGWVERWLQSGREGALRPIVFAIVFGALYILVDRYGPKLGALSRALSLFGRHSLGVYAGEAVLVYLIAYLHFAKTWWDNSLATIIAMGILWLVLLLASPSRAKSADVLEKAGTKAFAD